MALLPIHYVIRQYNCIGVNVSSAYCGARQDLLCQNKILQFNLNQFLHQPFTGGSVTVFK